MPIMLSRKLKPDDDRQRRSVRAGNVIAARVGQGRVSRPENLTMRAGKPEVEDVGNGGDYRRRGR